MNILVTGATGFIGHNLVEQLVQRGERVHLLCRPTANVSIFNQKNVHVCWGNILDAASVSRSLEGCDRVFHLAAYAKNWASNPNTFIEMNVGGLKNILDAAQSNGVKKVIFISSVVTLGPSNGVATSESSVRTTECFTDYERSKILAEETVKEYVRGGMHVVIVNPTRVFGPGLMSEGNSVTKMIQWYLEGKWRFILGDGNGVGNYAFVQDLVNGMLLAMEHGKSGERYVLGGENVSYNKFFEVLSEVSGRHHKLFHLPAKVAMLTSQVEEWCAKHFQHYPAITPGWVKTFLADWAVSCAKAEQELGYRITPLREAFEITIDWLRQQGNEVSK